MICKRKQSFVKCHRSFEKSTRTFHGNRLMTSSSYNTADMPTIYLRVCYSDFFCVMQTRSNTDFYLSRSRSRSPVSDNDRRRSSSSSSSSRSSRSSSSRSSSSRSDGRRFEYTRVFMRSIFMHCWTKRPEYIQ